MSLDLLGQYDSDTDDESNVSKSPSELYQQDYSEEREGKESKSRSYFEESFSDASSITGSEDQSDEEDSCHSSPEPVGEALRESLPLPELQRIHSGEVKASPGSVFSNPYKEAEDAKLAILKKHVSLAPSEEHPNEKQEKKRFNRRKRMKRPQIARGEPGEEQSSFDKDDSSIRKKQFNRIRTGLADGLVPSQKYMKFHHKQQTKERPWTIDK